MNNDVFIGYDHEASKQLTKINAVVAGRGNQAAPSGAPRLPQFLHESLGKKILFG
jgi:hypothetical protein